MAIFTGDLLEALICQEAKAFAHFVCGLHQCLRLWSFSRFTGFACTRSSVPTPSTQRQILAFKAPSWMASSKGLAKTGREVQEVGSHVYSLFNVLHIGKQYIFFEIFSNKKTNSSQLQHSFGSSTNIQKTLLEWSVSLAFLSDFVRLLGWSCMNLCRRLCLRRLVLSCGGGVGTSLQKQTGV